MIRLVMMTKVTMTMVQSLVFRGAHKSQLQRRPDVSPSYKTATWATEEQDDHRMISTVMAL